MEVGNSFAYGNPLFSYIVAIYNAKSTLSKCLSSIRNQTFADFEVIMVDDGSLDGCSAIAKNFAKRDPRFHYYWQQNSGSSVAYNKGLELAKGKYVVYLDNDDWDSPRTLEATSQAIMADAEIDIVQFSLHKENEGSNNRETPEYMTSGTFSGAREIKSAALHGLFNTLTHSGKAIRRSLFDGPDPIRFKGFAKGADLFVIRRLICLTNKICVVPAAEWHFLIRASSQSHSPIRPCSLAEYHRYGVDMVLNELPIYLKYLDPKDTLPIWELDDLAWDSFVAYCRSLGKTDSFKRNEIVLLARKIWKARRHILSNKKRRIALKVVCLSPGFGLLFLR